MNNIEIPPVLRPPAEDSRPVYRRGLSPSAQLLHEIIIRALQMILNGWKKYLEDEKKRSQQE